MDEEVRWIRMAYARHRLEEDRVGRAPQIRQPTETFGQGPGIRVEDDRPLSSSSSAGNPGRGPVTGVRSDVPDWFAMRPGETRGARRARWESFQKEGPREGVADFCGRFRSAAQAAGLLSDQSPPDERSEETIEPWFMTRPGETDESKSARWRKYQSGELAQWDQLDPAARAVSREERTLRARE